MASRPKANLFIVGAPKCGTTAWWSYLSQHPQVFMSPFKEPHFFSTDFPGFRWVKARTEYDELFSAAGGYRVRGEASVMYLYSEAAALAIRAYNPEARIIICLRDHESFLRSYHSQLCLNLDEDVTDFRRAVDLEAERREGREVPERCRDAKFLFYSSVVRFAPQVERYLDAFSAEQVMILRLEEWSKAPLETWAAVEQFLGLDHVEVESLEPVNERRSARSTTLSKLYRSPSKSARQVARVLRTLGVDTRRVARMLKDANESASPRESHRSALGDAWQARFHRDSVELESLCKPVCSALAAARGK